MAAAITSRLVMPDLQKFTREIYTFSEGRISVSVALHPISSALPLLQHILEAIMKKAIHT